jgi:hypothetical protein
MNFYDATVAVLTHKLDAINRWLDKAIAFAEQKKFDPETLLVARLAPDQFPLIRQIQIACDNAKAMVARLADWEVPEHPDTEKTIVEIRDRIRKTIDFLRSVTREDLADADQRLIVLPWMEDGKTMRATDYLLHYAFPNFYFHLTTAYAILRHNGVDVGKRDYIAYVPFQS